MATDTSAAVTATPAAPVKKGGNPLLIIIIIIVVLLICCGIIGGAAYFITRNATNIALNSLNNLSNQIKNDVNNNMQNSINNLGSTGSGSNNSTGTGSTDSGTNSFGNQLPAGFPSDVPIYTNAKVGFGGAEHSNGKDSYSVTLTSPDSVNDIISFYKSQLPSNGWTITEEQSYFGSSITATKDNREVTVVVLGGEKAGDSSSITIAVNTK